MNICFIGYQASRYREAIFRALDKEYNCDWYIGNPHNDIKNMDISLLNKVYRFNSFGNPTKCYWKIGLLNLIFKKKYDVFLIFSESRCVSDYFFIALSRIFNRKVFLWTHGWYGKENKFESFLKRWQFKNVDGVFVYSNYSRNLMIEQGLSKDKIFTIHNSLDYDVHISLRENIRPSSLYFNHFENDYPVIVFIGRLTKVKQLDMLVKSLSYLKKDGKLYNLVFIGDGVERQHLESLVSQHKLQAQVWFYGACYDEKINAELIYNASLCVAPGNIGLTAIHAMAFGTPVISHSDFKWQMPEFEAIKPGVTGDFFVRNDVQSLAETIERWLNNNVTKREEVRNACFNEIDTQWNPQYQINIFKTNLK